MGTVPVSAEGAKPASDPAASVPAFELPFNERKAVAAVGILLKKAGGQMSYMRLVKLVYAADREMMREIGQPIVGGHYFSLPHGPVTSEVLDLAKHAPLPVLGELWAKHFERENYDLKLTVDADLGPLSRAEEEVLDKVWELYKHLDQFQLSEVFHRAFKEWCDPGKSRKEIRPEDILLALDKTPEQIEDARETAVEQAFLDELLGC